MGHSQTICGYAERLGCRAIALRWPQIDCVNIGLTKLFGDEYRSVAIKISAFEAEDGFKRARREMHAFAFPDHPRNAMFLRLEKRVRLRRGWHATRNKDGIKMRWMWERRGPRGRTKSDTWLLRLQNGNQQSVLRSE